MDKILTSSISKSYAKALYDSLYGQDVMYQLNEISDTINSSADLKIIMSNSSVSISNKLEILDTIFSSKIDTKLLNLLKVLAEKHRFNEFDSIKQSYFELIDEKANRKNVVIVSAIDLDENYKQNILNKLSEKLNSQVVPSWTVDNSLIAGLIFKYDDCVIDTSLSTKLKNLGKNITV